jgi:hypothetical protein
MRMTGFWDTESYNFVEVDRRFRGAYCDPIALMEAVLTSETSVYFN